MIKHDLVIRMPINDYSKDKPLPIEEIKEVLAWSTWDEGRYPFGEEMIMDGAERTFRNALYRAISMVVEKLYPRSPTDRVLNENRQRYNSKIQEIRLSKAEYYLQEPTFTIEDHKITEDER